MKHTWNLIPTLLIVIVLLASTPVQAAESAPAATQTETPQSTDLDEYEETVPPPEAANSTNTPTPTFVPPPTQTPIPRVPGTGLPVVVPLLDSGLPNDGFGPEWYPPYINPLTGLVVPDPLRAPAVRLVPGGDRSRILHGTRHPAFYRCILRAAG